MRAAMSTLFEPDRHERPCADPWDASRVRAALQRLATDTEDQRRADGLWPMHPRDDEGQEPPDGHKGLYLGAAGVLWALWTLREAGAVTLRHDPADGFERVVAAYLAAPDSGRVEPSYFLGETGLRLVQWRLTGDDTAADRLHAVVAANLQHPSNESLWGAPGTMMAAWHLWRATGQARWRTLFEANVEAVWATWAFDETARCPLWTQDLYGRTVQYLGAGHGFAGNATPLLKGAALLPAARRAELFRRVAATTAHFALHDGAAVNWPAATSPPRPGRPLALVQWCHGAPGFVTALADLPAGTDAAFDALLEGAGELVWQAGPLTKGPGLCHGTAGNGYAFLKLHRRTGQAVWLARARVFAMHALAQSERERAAAGRGRHTLWTGDLGLAVYLWHCLGGDDTLPAFDAV